jgi:NADPH:quinone reductase-like Zn-dependent oxidoreductase
MSRLDLDDLSQLAQLAAEGLLVPVVTARFPLDEAADALRIVASGHARGKVILVP